MVSMRIVNKNTSLFILTYKKNNVFVRRIISYQIKPGYRCILEYILILILQATKVWVMFLKKLDYLRKVLRSGLCAYLSLQMNFAMRKILCPQHSHIIKHITNVLYFIPGICFHYVLLHCHILISIIYTFVPKLHSSTRMFRFQFNLYSIQALIHN